MEAIRIGLEILEHGKADIVIGDRRLKNSVIEGTTVALRQAGSRVFNFVVQLLVLPGYKDTQCCLKGFQGDLLKKIVQRSIVDSYAIDVELIYLAQRNGYTIERIPVKWKDVRSAMLSGVGLRILLREIRQLIKIRYSHHSNCL